MRIRSPQQLRRAQRSRDPVGTHARAGTNHAVLILEPVGRTILEGAGSTKKATREEYALRRTGARQGLHDEGSVSILCLLYTRCYTGCTGWRLVPRAASITRCAFLAGSTSPSRLPRLVLTRFMVHGPLKSMSVSVLGPCVAPCHCRISARATPCSHTHTPCWAVGPPYQIVQPGRFVPCAPRD